MMTHHPSEGHTTSLPDFPRLSSPFSIFITVLATIFFFTSVGVIVWSYSSLSALDRVAAPERSLERLTSRAMELEYALTQVSKGERLVYRILSGNENVLKRAGMEYQELAEFSSDPLVDLYGAILEAEAGRLEKVSKHIQAWKSQPAPLPLFKQFIQSAYLMDAIPPAHEELLQAQLAEEVPDNWFYSRLAILIAKKGENASFELLTQKHLDERAQQLFSSSRSLVLLEVSGGLLGFLFVLVLVRKTIKGQPGSLRVSQGALPPPWKGSDGFAVLVRGGAVTTFLFFALFFLDLDSQGTIILNMAILYFPILLLTYFLLLRPHELTLVRAFGLRFPLSRIHRIISVIFVLLGVGLCGNWLITVGVGTGHASLHWTEWFDHNLVWGTPTDVVVTLIEYSILAPVFEELIFRGVLFATFRRKFGWEISAVLSSFVFAVVHGYGLVGLLTVFWSGVLWAWAYEKTGSLWPGMIAHGMNNLLVSLMLVALFR